MRFLHIIQEIFPRQWGIVVDVTLSVGVMVLFRDRFRLVAPSYGTKFAHALIKYRLSQMSLHRIHHPPQKAVHDVRKAPLSPPRPKPIGALWLVLQFFPQPACFPITSGWGVFPVSTLSPQPACFSLASGWGIFPILRLFPQSACFPLASGWRIFPILRLFPQFTCFLLASGWGILPILQLFPQFTCFSIASGWGSFPVFTAFPPIHLLPYSFRLGDFIHNFYTWSNFHFSACFAPTGFLLQLPLSVDFPILYFSYNQKWATRK